MRERLLLTSGARTEKQGDQRKGEAQKETRKAHDGLVQKEGLVLSSFESPRSRNDRDRILRSGSKEIRDRPSDLVRMREVEHMARSLDDDARSSRDGRFAPRLFFGRMPKAT